MNLFIEYDTHKQCVTDPLTAVAQTMSVGSPTTGIKFPKNQNICINLLLIQWFLTAVAHKRLLKYKLKINISKGPWIMSILPSHQ